MTLIEKIIFSTDETRFPLFKEGIFYKCFNEDAIFFQYKIRKK